jgi:thiol-disulfide isomerase/thioredoxin
MKASQLLLVGILARASGAPIVALAEDNSMVQQRTSKAAPLPIEGEFPSLGGATGWLNSPPLTPEGLRGKVVLVQVWTYTCINWLRTLPYVRAWAEKYKDQGLVVIGVHTPEFPFEKNLDNVRREAKNMGVDYPIAIDNKSPENYVGYERTENFESPGGAVPDQRHVYGAPAKLELNHWALSGDWTVGKQATRLNQANGRIVYCFHSRDLHLVMGPGARGTSVRFRVLIDGQPPGAAHGIDVDDQGYGTVNSGCIS